MLSSFYFCSRFFSLFSWNIWTFLWLLKHLLWSWVFRAQKKYHLFIQSSLQMSPSLCKLSHPCHLNVCSFLMSSLHTPISVFMQCSCTFSLRVSFPHLDMKPLETGVVSDWLTWEPSQPVQCLADACIARWTVSMCRIPGGAVP